MSRNNENVSNVNDELSKVNLSLYEYSIELWRLEEKCRLKSLSIDDIEKSTVQVNIENKWLENQLLDKKSRIEEVKEYIVSMDNIIFSFYETLAHLEVENKKKESSINKTKNDYELQLFIKMELWQKEEERFENIPEVKSLKIANLELNNIKLEYEELLDCKKNLTEKIKKAEEQNDVNLKDVVVEFSKVYVEMLTLNNRENNCITLLRKLEIEYAEKLKMKNELLELSKKKVNKISFWTHNFCPFDSKMIDIKLDSLNQELKTHLKYSNSYDFTDIQKCNNEDILKSNNKQKKKVTFLLSSEDQISNTNNDILTKCQYVKTNLVKNNAFKNDIDSNSSQMKDIVNTSSTQQFQKHSCRESSNENFNDNEKRMNEHDFDFQTNKLKIIEENFDFEFKKPLNPIQQENQMNRDLTLKNVQTSATNSENIRSEKSITEHQEKGQSLNLPPNNYKRLGSYLDNDVHLRERSSLESVQQSNLKNFTYENSKIFELQSNETSSKPNNTFSGLYSNDYSELGSQTSPNNSSYISDVSELFGNPYDISQYSNMQLNFPNSFNTNSRANTVSNLQESNVRNPQQSDICLDDYIDQTSQNSTNSSFRGSDLSELFGNSYGIGQYPNMQLNFSNSFNVNSNTISDSNSQELNMKNQE